jgi:predicted transcriptional regulator YdeE
MNKAMNEITIDKKKYVVVAREDYEELQEIIQAFVVIQRGQD